MDQFEFKDTKTAPPDDTADRAHLAITSAQTGDTPPPDDPFATLTYDETVEMARTMAPSSGIEGTDIGSGG